MNKTVGSKRNLVHRAFTSLGALKSHKRPVMTTAVTALTLTAAGILVVAGLISPSASRADNDDEIKTLTVDVAQIGSTNAQNDVDPSEGQFTFTRGDTFILDGTIYPNGTLVRGNADNVPTVPGIGKYTIRATNTGGPGTVPTVAFATELFLLPDDATSILTDGLWPNERFSAHRVVLGGTGRFRYSAGEVYEENLGLNKDGFCNLRVTFKIRKAAFRHDHDY
jgi:hypothetical protein